MGRNALDIFCAPLYAYYLSNLPKKFQVACTYDTNAEYKILRFFIVYFLVQLTTGIHKNKPLEMWFLDSDDLSKCKSSKISISEICPQTILSLLYTLKKED